MRAWQITWLGTLLLAAAPQWAMADPPTSASDDETLGTLFYDLDAAQPGGPGLFFVRTPLERFP